MLTAASLLTLGGTAFIIALLPKHSPADAAEKSEEQQVSLTPNLGIERVPKLDDAQVLPPADHDEGPSHEKNGVAPSPRSEADLVKPHLRESDPAFYVKRGQTSLEKKDYDTAISEFSEAIRLEPNNAWALSSRGYAWSMKKNYDKAIDDYNESIRLDPLNASVFNVRGNAWLEKKEYDKAIHDYDDAIRLDSKLSWPFNNRAIAWSRKKDYDKAIKDHDEAIRLDPREAAFYCNLAWLLISYPDSKAGDGKRAIELATKACELTDWKRGVPLTTLAAAYARGGQFDEAQRYQSKALQDPAYQGPAGDDFRRRLEFYRQRKLVRVAQPAERGVGVSPPAPSRMGAPAMTPPDPGQKVQTAWQQHRYKKRIIHGFTCFVSEEVIRHNDDGLVGDGPLDILEQQLRMITESVPAKTVRVLRDVAIWVQWDDPDPDPPPPSWVVRHPGQKWSGAIAKYYGGSGLWRLQKGQDPRMAFGLEILSLSRLASTPRKQSVILHELAHAVHRVLIGYDDPVVKGAYRQAMDRKLYDQVHHDSGYAAPAYATTNHLEYFAELSCAYLQHCDFFPHDREDLRGHDSVGYQVMEKVWGKSKKR